MPLCRAELASAHLEKRFFFFSFPAIGEAAGEGVLRDRGSFIFKAMELPSTHPCRLGKWGELLASETKASRGGKISLGEKMG